MYRNLGNVSASCLLGGMAALFLPIPFLLVFYGHKVRKASKVSRVIAEQQELRALQVQRKLESQQKQKHSA